VIKTFTVPGRFHFQMELDPSFPADKHLINQGINYEPEIMHLLLRTLKPGDHAVDVGANVGYFTLMMAALVGNTGRVTAFEPDLVHDRKMLKSVQLNTHIDGSRIICCSKPVWSEEEPVTFYTSADDTAGSALWNPGKWPGNTKSQTLGTYHQTRDATTLDASAGIHSDTKVIKLDIEGAELQALKGQSWMLWRPLYIICELNPFALEQMGESQESLREFMDQFGYETYLLYRSGQMPKFVSPHTKIMPQHIINILFSNSNAVSDAWPEEIMDERIVAR
jgi:FkbM family methyltransferase